MSNTVMCAMCLLTKLHCNCCHKFCLDYMLEFCEEPKECSKVECHYTRGAFCNFCEERCRTNDKPCISTNFEAFKRVEDKTEKLKELSKSEDLALLEEKNTIFYPENPVTKLQFTDV